MYLTLERLRFIYTEINEISQFIGAVIGLVSILLLFVPKTNLMDDDSGLLPNCVTSFLHKAFYYLGLPQLMMYIRPQEYYENLLQKLNESELAKSSKGAVICLSSHIELDDESALVSGLVNTGNSCFLNSVLQAMSSLPHLHCYLQHVSNMAAGVPLPVTRTLLKTVRSLTKPLNRRTSFRPVDIVTALSSNRRIISREQQDAQEFFQMVSSAMDNEGHQIAKTELLGGGLKDLLNGYGSGGIIGSEKSSTKVDHALENPFTGLLANRLSCMKCGYTGAIRHFSFNNIQLSVPNKHTTTLAECLSQFTSMEYLEDANCRRCSFKATLESVKVQLEQVKQKIKKSNNNKDSKKKRERVIESITLERTQKEIEYRLKMGTIEEENDKDRLSLLKSTCISSKQVMLAKPPKILCLHISRSAFLNTGAIYKNTCQILFPEYLDVSAFTTNGTLHTQPNLPISTPTTRDTTEKYYRLMSIIVHYGSHSFGHFVAFKRRIFAEQCMCGKCNSAGAAKEVWKCQDVWYRISDSKVDECSLEDVLRSNPYMILYELVDKENEMEEEDEEDMSVLSADYNNIPMDMATKEALRIANSLLNFNEDELLAANGMTP
ncbi:hypothetical protein HPULCUR_010179 [Helicostylum pulchrum]|uniref:Ubiquitin carboxyl-terminal hydrolase n=1 Tax=Helicostylum pulchrum TaxID=562976 RepID=A0ABP9YCJ0_9FUNG